MTFGPKSSKLNSRPVTARDFTVVGKKRLEMVIKRTFVSDNNYGTPSSKIVSGSDKWGFKFSILSTSNGRQLNTW